MKETLDSRISKLAKAAESRLIHDRRDFHKHAESGWTEFRTAAVIAQRLTELGFEVRSGRDVCSSVARMGLPPDDVLESHWILAGSEGADPAFLEPSRGGFTGVVGILRNGTGPSIGLRFDIDALDLSESSETSHRPANEGFASIHKNVCHACGHSRYIETIQAEIVSLTYAGFSATLSGLTITGVATKYAYTPNIDTSGNYPMLFPRIPAAERAAITLTSAAGLKNVTGEIVVVIERDTLGTASSRYAETAAMVDAIDTALATEAAANHQIDSWTITPEINEYGWSLVATVEGSG